MPNRDGPSGFTPIRHANGAQIRTEEVPLAAANAIIGIGDPVVQTAAGVYDRAVPAGPVDGIAASSADANAGGNLLIYADEDIIYRAQTDNGVGVLTVQTGMNLNADFVIANAVDGKSIAEIDESSGAVNAALPFTVLRLYPDVNNALGEFNILEVRINASHRRAGVAGI